MLDVSGSVAQFEREMMLERPREGIARAKREGRSRMVANVTIGHAWLF